MSNVVKLIAAPHFSAKPVDYHLFYDGYDRGKFGFWRTFDSLGETWKELYNLAIAMPDQYDHICSGLETRTHKAWHIHNELLELSFYMKLQDDYYPDDEERRQPRESVRQYITYLMLWTLLKTNTVEREEIWKRHNKSFNVYRDRRFDVERDS